MTTVLTSQATPYDGLTSGNVYTATGPIVVTMYCTDGSPYVGVFSRSDSVPYVETAVLRSNKRVRIELVSGDQFYFLSDPNTSISYVDA